MTSERRHGIPRETCRRPGVNPPDAGLARLGDRIVEGILWRLDRLGIQLRPFVTIREGSVPSGLPPPDGEFAFSEVTAANIRELVELEPGTIAEKHLERFRQGKLCFGLWHGPRLVAKTWCDLDEINSKWGPRKLAPDEVYLFWAYSDPAYRGRNLAPALRLACYAEMRSRGYARFCSYSEFFNRPARRFKQKLGAIEQDARLYVGLFGRWSTTFTLKRYS